MNMRGQKQADQEGQYMIEDKIACKSVNRVLQDLFDQYSEPQSIELRQKADKCLNETKDHANLCLN